MSLTLTGETLQSAAVFCFWAILLLLMAGVLLFVAFTLLAALVAGVRACRDAWRGKRAELPELPE